MALSVIQQQLFSFFNLVPVVPLKRLYEVYEEIVNCSRNEKPPNLERLYREISLLNRRIQNYDLEIVASVDELSSQKLFILVNTSENTVTQKTKFYDKNTTQYFSRIAQDCILSEEGHISETHCLNLSSQFGISKNSAQTILEKFIRDKWIVSKDGTISLAMRSIIELEQNIKQHYPNEVKYCPFCKLMIIRGYICKNCKLRGHYSCVRKYFKVSKSDCTCPECNESWNDVPDRLQLAGYDITVKEEEQIGSPDPVPAKKRRKS